MTKKVIAIDVDDVLAAEKEAVRMFINTTYGLNHTEEDYGREGPYWGYFESVWDVGDRGKEWFEAYESSNTKLIAAAVDGAVEAITKLKEHHELVVVTSRNDRHVEKTHTWLEKYFPKAFETVEFVTLWDKDRKVTKATICKAIGANYLIDDNLDHCTLAAEAGVEALLFGNYGWNKAETLPQGVSRVNDWKAVTRYFDGKD